MKENLDNVICNVAKVEALMYAIEAAYIGVMPDDYEMLVRAESAFYAVWDIVRIIQQELNEMGG